MLVRALFAGLVVFAGAFAQAQSQPELPFEHPDEILVKAWLGQPNVRLVEESTLAKVVADTFSGIEVPFEMGDGYYDLKVSAMYEITNPKNSSEVVGYMGAYLMSYTEDSDYSLATIYVNPRGRLVNPDWVIESSPYSAEEIAEDFPPELQLPVEEN